MFGKGYFIGGTGSSGGSSGNGASEDLIVDREGNIVYAPFDPVLIDEDGLVYFNNDDKNARIYAENNEIYVEKVI